MVMYTCTIIQKGSDIMIFAYTRISTAKESQRHDRQIKAISDFAEKNIFEIDRIYSDTVSGKTKTDTRPQYQLLKQVIRKGDILIISDLDRIGRDASNVIAELNELKSSGIKVIALDIPYMNDFNNIQNDSMYNMIVDILITLKAHIAQQEREKIVSRINQGLEVAKASKVKLGRPKRDELPPEFVKTYRKFKNKEYGKMKATDFAKMLGVSRSTLYNYINTYNEIYLTEQ